ncbi:hypothetical protein [Stenotrophomonas geniculata]
MDAALRTMGMVSSGIMDRDEAWEIASNAVAVRIAAGWSRDMLDSSTESGRAPCGRGYYLFCSGLIAVCYFPMVCITDMNGRGYHFHIARTCSTSEIPAPTQFVVRACHSNWRCSDDRPARCTRA